MRGIFSGKPSPSVTREEVLSAGNGIKHEGFVEIDTPHVVPIPNTEPLLFQTISNEEFPAIIAEILDQKDARIDLLEDIIHQIDNWTLAYPFDIAPKPDLDADRKLLGEAEFSCLNADAMRHVIEGVKDIIKPAVEGKG
jgi:hypothetical protein